MFGCDARCPWLKEHALSDFKAYSWGKTVTPSTKLYYVQPFPGPLSNFYSLIEVEILDQASLKVATEEPNYHQAA